MNILSWIIFGLIAGVLAKVISPGKNDPQGCVVTIVLGILGAFVGGFIGTRLGFGAVTGFNLKSLGIAILGSVILLLINAVIRGR